MDFAQGMLTTIHDYRPVARPQDAAALRALTRERPAALIIPALEEELHRPAFQQIMHELRSCDFLSEVVLSLTTDREDSVEEARHAMRKLPTKTRVVWCEDPSVGRILEDLGRGGVPLPRPRGKGFAVWLASGIVHADHYAMAFHDADIEGYSGDFPARLLFPLVSPKMDYFFAKAYYGRITNERLFGRVTRLFVWPFIDALQQVHGKNSQFLRYLRSFRYPLSGEFAATSDLFTNLRIPTDWGLEGGLLAEVYRNANLRRICQVDLGFYSHKHREIGEQSGEGLGRMARDFAATVFRTWTETDAVVLGPSELTTIQVLYRRIAQDFVRKYFGDALANGLAFDRHAEEVAIERFQEALIAGGRLHLEDPARNVLPDWLRVMSARSDISQSLGQANQIRGSAQRELSEVTEHP